MGAAAGAIGVKTGIEALIGVESGLASSVYGLPVAAAIAAVFGSVMGAKKVINKRHDIV